MNDLFSLFSRRAGAVWARLFLLLLLLSSTAIAFATPGALVWAKRAGGQAQNCGNGVAACADGGALVTGSFMGTATFGAGEAHQTILTSAVRSRAVFLARYAADGTLAWVKSAEGAGSEGLGVAVCADGGVLVTGDFAGTVTFGAGEAHQTILSCADYADIFLARYTPDGTLVWAKGVGGTWGDYGMSVAACADGGALVTGDFAGTAVFGAGEANQTILTSSSSSDIFLARYAADGTLAWAKSAGGPTAGDSGYGVAACADGGALVTGYTQYTATFGAGEANQTILTATYGPILFLARYSASGTLVWVRSAGNTASESFLKSAAGGSSVAVCADGGALVTGYFRGTATFGAGEANQTILETTGTKEINIGNNTIEENTDDILLARYSSEGMLVWAKRAGGTADDYGMSVAVCADGGALVTGQFQDTATFGAGEANQTILTSAGDYSLAQIDVFLACYAPDGTLVWAKGAGGTLPDSGNSVAVCGDGDALVTGSFTDPATFGAGEVNQTILTSASGSYDVFLARYSVSNPPPVAVNDSYTTAEDTPLTVAAPGVLNNDSDPDGDALTAVKVTDPSHGTVTQNANGSFTYTPSANYNGADSFTYQANDGQISSVPATVSITVTPVNDAPTAAAQSVTTAEDMAKAITLTGSDVDGDVLTFAIVTGPAHGTLTGTAPTLTYTPALNYHGPDSFTFTVNDGTVDSAVATVTITVTPVNDAPVAAAQSVTTAEDAAKAITLTGSDVDGDVLTFAIVTGPAHGTLTGTAPALTYTPAADYHGPDSFTFTANDGALDSDLATVTITVTSVNDAPTAAAQSVTTAEDTAKTITLTGSDVDGDVLTFAIVTGPAHGTLTGTAPDLTYTPAADYHGPDSFIFTVNDGTVNSAPATVNITVTPVNDPPVAAAQSVTTAEDTAKTITLTGSDVDGDVLTFAIVTGPAHGTLTGTAPTLTYTPALNYHGPDSFTFTVNDGTVDSAVATVTITVTPVNDAPVAAAQSVTTAEDAAKAITLTGSDVDGDVLTFAIVTGPAHGTLTGTAPALTYTPAADYHGPDSFTFTANDGALDSDLATVTITVTSVNDAPTAAAQSVTTAEDTAKTITLTGSDVDGDVLTFAIVTGPAHGTLTGTAPDLTYTPAADYHGPDSFIFTVNDGTVNSAPATVNITVTPVNDPPVAAAQSVTTAEDTAKTITLTGSDVDGDVLTFAIVTGPAHGTLTGTAPTLTYTPALNYHGPDSFTFTANDGALDSDPATVTITVTPVNDAPTAAAQSVTTAEDAAKAITLTGSDVDGDILTFAIVTGPAHGTLTGTAPALTYTPAADYHGPDSFTFTVNDGTVDSAVATVNITVTPVNDAPVAAAQSVTTAEDAAKAITLTGSDVDGDPLNFAIVTGPAHGTLTGTAPTLTYTPALNYHGPDSFTFTVNDGTVDSAVATVNITVTPVNDAPVAAAQSVTTAEDAAKAITLTGSDVDGDALTFAIVTGPVHGTLTGTAPTLTYTPAADYHGPDSFTFTANDCALDSAVATVNITVTPVNDPPVANPQAVITPSNTPKTITLTGTDVDGDALTFTIDTGPAHGTLSGTAPNLVYTPALNYAGTDSFCVCANDGQVTSAPAVVSLTITGGNTPPVIGSIIAPIDPLPVQSNNVAVSATFIDPDAGDTHTAVWSWDDGTSTDGTVNEATGVVTGTHTYNVPGVYEVKLTVTDRNGACDQAAYQYVVIYDPSSGFVTGGGWINSPTGAYLPDPTLTGKASFGFVSKYKKGAAIPDGKTEFNFTVGKMNFSSTKYDWLVVNKFKAQFKGTGTINGAGQYQFILSAIDGDVKNGGGLDKFRIKITDAATNTLVYDNQLDAADNADPTTVIGGGSIVIH